MGWSGVRLTTSLQLSTKIHRAERVHTHQSLFWVNFQGCEWKYFKQFI